MRDCLKNRWINYVLLLLFICMPAFNAHAQVEISMSVTSGPHAHTGSTPVEWLHKMGDSLRRENYAGNFTYIRGSRFDNVRIVHVVQEGREFERLYNLNGPVRELYREEEKTSCFQPKGELPRDEYECPNFHLGPFTPLFSERVLSTQNLYNLEMQNEDRIAGRASVVLVVSPKLNDRFGYRVWLDKVTGLLLQSHLIERGKVKEIFQFTHIEVGKSVSASNLKTAIRGEIISRPFAQNLSKRRGEAGWKVNWLPDGFKLVRTRGNRLHFTDGLATFSVFIETLALPAMPDLATTEGGTALITRRHKITGPQITVVGEVPVQTARRVAESVAPVVY